MSKVIAIVDGEFMRKRIINLKAFYFDGPSVRRHCMKHLFDGEEMARIMFYDSTPFMGKGEHPLTGPIDFSTTALVSRKTAFLKSLQVTPMMQSRLGRSAWQAGQWILDSVTLGELLAGEISAEDIQVDDIYPDIRQKGVDVCLGLDIARIVYEKLADRIVLVACDADYIPAVQFAREHGVTVTLDPLWSRASEDLRNEVDYVHNVLERPDPTKYDYHIHIFDDAKEYDRTYDDGNDSED